MKFNGKEDSKRIFLCLLASVVMSLNLSTFVHTGGLLPGGFSGLTILIINLAQKFLGVTLTYGPIYIILNALPIVLSFQKLGKKFTIFSCFTIIMTSILTDIIPQYVITYDVLLISIFGGLINGFGISLCLFAGATSGGTDFISIYISEKYGIDAWNYILCFNAIMLITDGFLFGWDKALYSILFQYASTQMIRTCYKHYNKNTLFIVTDHPEAVTQVINRETTHGATEIKVIGAYEDKQRMMVYSVISSDELKKVVSGLKKSDPTAFVNVMKTEELSGRFIMRPKD
ncbi:MAG: YitT family protein [Lachnospiraceae bacterium]|nr:YitT family protein [Lachnospiraceae bacterium]